ncbi:MAG: PEP-CTERM sorting domain-containing protein [Akkermansia sp.]
MRIATKDSSSDASITLHQEGASIESKQLSQAQVAHGLITIQSASTPSPLLRAMAQSVYNSDASIYDTELVDTLIVMTSGASLRLDEVQLDSLSRISGDASSSVVAHNLSIEATNAQNMSIEGNQYRISLLEADASTLITLEGMLNININMTADEYLAFTALLDAQVNPSIVLEGISSIEGLNAMGITISSTVDGVEQEMPDFAVVGLSEQGSLTLQAIPEPSSTSLTLLALAALLMRRKRRI